MIRNYPVHPVVTITIAAAVTVRDLRGRAVVLVLPDPEAVPVPLVQWDLRAPRVNPDFKATQVLSDLLEPLALLARQYMHNKENAVTMRLSAHYRQLNNPYNYT